MVFTFVLCGLLCCSVGQDRAVSARKLVSCDQIKRVESQETVEIRNHFLVGRLAGVVISPLGPVIPGIAVELIDRKGRCLSATFTDEDGKFDFGTMRPGSYGIRISKPGFNTVIAKVKLSSGSKRRLKLEMPLSN